MQASEATKQCEELRAELSAIQARFATANRRATEVANAAPRPLPPSLALAKAPSQAAVTSSADAAVEVNSETRNSPQHEQPRKNSVSDGAQAVALELEESLGDGAGTLLDEFIAEAAAYRCASTSISENNWCYSRSCCRMVGLKRRRLKLRFRRSARSSRVWSCEHATHIVSGV